MNRPVKNSRSPEEKTLLLGIVLSSPGMLVTGLAAYWGRSTTQLADFFRRTTELAAVFIGWVIYRLLKQEQRDAADRLRLERLSGQSVGGAMLLTGLVVLLLAMIKFFRPQPVGRVTTGLIVALLGLAANSAFWLRYRALLKEEDNAVVAGQSRLYLAKVWVDACVVSALLVMLLFPTHPVTPYIDFLGSVGVSLYLFKNGAKVLKDLPTSLAPDT